MHWIPRASQLCSLVGAAFALVAVCSISVPASAQGDGTTKAEGVEATPSGHERMLALLAEIAEQAPIDNPYLGEAGARVVRARLAALPDSAPSAERARLLRDLGRHELRLGREEEALRRYLEAYAVLRKGGSATVADGVETFLGLGVTYLRMGETLNCARRHTADSCILPIRDGGVHVDKEPSRNAVRYFEMVLANTSSRSIAYTKARWLLNIAYMTLGEYPAGVPDRYRILPQTFKSDEDFPRFVNVAASRGLDSFDLAGGAVAEDFDGDGWLDLIVSTSDTAGPMHYYRNNGNGTFTDRTKQAGLNGLLGGLNLVQADYDNDGDTDLLVLRGAWYRELGKHPNSLLRNDGNGTFRDVTFEAGLGRAHYPTQTAAWADYDNDGDLDLYVGNEDDGVFRPPCQLFRNDGDGKFTDVAEQAGLSNHRFAKSVVWGDYDDDGFADLYVSNGGNENRLYHNDGDGTFTDVAGELGVAGPIHSFPAWFWDFDNDGKLDLFVTAYGDDRYFPDVSAVAASYLGIDPEPALARLYRGNGKGRFTDVAAEQGLDLATLPMGVNFGDLDNDGYPDFYLGTGYPLYEGLTPNVMYRNRRGQGFSDVTTNGGFGHLQKGHGVVFADLDHDGDQDVFEQMGGGYPGDAFGNVLYENPGFGNHWIKLELVGTRSNRSAIGARIRLRIVEDGKKRDVYRHVNSGASFGGNPLRQEIGIGRADRIELLEIRWPATGSKQTFRDVEIDRIVRIVEAEDTLRTVQARPPDPSR